MTYRVRANTTATPTSVRLPEDILARLRKESLKDNVTVSYKIILLLREALEARDREKRA